LIDGQSLALYCAQTIDAPLSEPQRRRLVRAIESTEHLCDRAPSVRDDFPRIIQSRVLHSRLHDSPLQPLVDDPFVGCAVIRAPRYAVRNREAPKRSTLIRRLWSALR
jgi:hypothetical protein